MQEKIKGVCRRQEAFCLPALRAPAVYAEALLGWTGADLTMAASNTDLFGWAIVPTRLALRLLASMAK